MDRLGADTFCETPTKRSVSMTADEKLARFNSFSLGEKYGVIS